MEETIREQYPEGTRIELIQMQDPHPVEPGMRGRVSHVDDAGQIHMNWDNGRTLALNMEADQFRLVEDGKALFRGVLVKIFERRVRGAERQEGKFYYEMRHGDSDWSEPYSIELGVMVNFWGTLEADQELPLEDDDFGRKEILLSDDEVNFMVMNAN